MKAKPRILLGVTGSIAAYKSAELLRLMKALEWDVHVILTSGGAEFVTELTFRTLSRNPVGRDQFDKTRSDWHPEHIALADLADVLVIAPCTANVMAKLAQGLSDDLLTASALACKAPLVLAPAMNGNMWTHAATVANATLLKTRGALFVDMQSGDLACGYQGQGRMAEPEQIMKVLARVVGMKRGKRS
jgi:phosphopantothenoylcysteine synthetase/decarboxylase